MSPLQHGTTTPTSNPPLQHRGSDRPSPEPSPINERPTSWRGLGRRIVGLTLLVILALAWPAAASAELLLVDPDHPMYDEVVLASDGPLTIRKDGAVTGNVHTNRWMLLKRNVVIDGDVSAVRRIINQGTVNGSLEEWVDPRTLPEIPDAEALRALADRVFEDDQTFTNEVINDVVFVEGDVFVNRRLDGVGTILATGDVRLRESSLAPGPDSRISIVALGTIRIDRTRTFRGVLRAGTFIDIRPNVTFEGIAISSGPLRVKRESLISGLAFEVDDMPPTVAIVEPVDGATVETPTPVITATWSDVGSGLDLASAELLVDGVDQTAAAVIEATGLSYQPGEPLAVGNHSLEVAIRDLAGLETRVTSNFSVAEAGTPPTLILVAPRESVVFEAPEIIVSYIDTDPGLDLASLTVELDGVSVLADCQPEDIQVVCVPDVAIGPHTLRVTIADLEGDTTTLEHDFERVAENQPPVLTVDEPVEGSLINQALVSVRGTVVDDGVVTQVTLGNQELTVTGTTFEGLIAVGGGPTTFLVEATDAAGNMASVTRSFEVDLEAPQVVLIAPRTETVTHRPEVRVQGTVSDANGVTAATLAGQPLTLDNDTFDTLAPLVEGENVLALTFTDGAGNVQELALEIDYQPLPEIAISEPVDLSATASPTVTVRGTVGPGITSVTVDGLPANLSGNLFDAEVTLHEGRNAITAVALASNGLVGSATVAVMLDATPPRLTIESPAEGLEVDRDRLTVRGMVADPVSGFDPPGALSVTVDGVAAEVSQGAYQVADRVLTLGENLLTVEATDALGNTTQQVRRVVYTPRTGEQLEEVSGNRQQAVVATVAGQPLVVRAVDVAGQPVPGQLVVFAVDGNDGLLAADAGTPGARKIAVTTDAQGLAQAFFTVGTLAGVATQRVEVSAVGYGDPVAFLLDGLPAAPDRLVVDSGNGQTGLVGATLSRELVAVAVDAAGNRLAGVAVEMLVQEGDGLLDTGLASKMVTTDGRGRAVARWALGGEAGISNQVVRASFVDFPELGFASFVASAVSAGDPADTRVVGVVLDNTDQPVPGATVGLAGSALSTTTGADGRFTLLGAPVGDALLVIDADTTSRPGLWPHLEFEMFLLPGIENRLDRPIYVLPLDTSEGVAVSETEGGTLTLAAVPGFALDIAPGSVTFPDGSRSGTVSVTPVHTDRVPMEPNFGQQPRFVVTIQPAGAKFDPPARLTLPNVSGLAPGRATEMFSFDHDLGRFVAIGHGTVSNDGTVIVSNPGVGVLEAGWHCGADPEDGAGSTHKCPPCRECDGDSCEPNPDVNGFPICDDKDRCTINDRCEDGYCRGTFVRIFDITGPCVAAVGQPVTFTAVSNGASLLRWRGGGSPPTGSGGSFTTTFGDSFVPPDQTEGSATVTASCALSKSKTIALGRPCGSVTPELIQELDEIPSTPTSTGKDKQGNSGTSKPHGLHETDHVLDFTGCLSGGKWCFQLKTLTAKHRIFVEENPPGRTPLFSPDDVNEGNCEDVIDDLTPKPQYACPSSGNEPRSEYFDFVPIPIVREHEDVHRELGINEIDQPLFNHMKAYIGDGRWCQNCSSGSPPDFQQEMEDFKTLLLFRLVYGIQATDLMGLSQALSNLPADPVRIDEGEAYRRQNAMNLQWIQDIRNKARNEGWSVCQ